MEAVVLFQVAKDRFDSISPFEPFPLPGGQALFLAIGPMDVRAVQNGWCSLVAPVGIEVLRLVSRQAKNLGQG